MDDINSYCNPLEKAMIDETLKYAFVGSPQAVRPEIEKFLHEIQPDELMITANVYDHSARLHSFALSAEISKSISG